MRLKLIAAMFFCLTAPCGVLGGEEARTRDGDGVRARDRGVRGLLPETGPASPLTIRASGGLSGSLRYTIEAIRVDFGAVSPGEPREILDAAVVRITSSEAWVLKMSPRGPSALATGSGFHLPMSRLAWRSGGGRYEAFQSTQPVIIATGPATTALGTEVRLDLRLAVEDEDPLASLALDLSVLVEAR